MRHLYTLFFYLALPLVLLRLKLRARRAPAYAQRWRERFGFVKPLESTRPVVWVHTVSVGEFLAAVPLLRELMKQPVQLVITATTPTGSERVRATFGESVYHSYAPYDLPDCLARFINRVQPSLMLIMETELWPNTLAVCSRRNIPAVLINGRLSARSARGYQRFARITRPMLGQLTAAAIQHGGDAARFTALGLPGERAIVTGNIKFDLTLGDNLRQQAGDLHRQWNRNGERLVWIAASTHSGEDEQILDALRQLRESDSPAARELLLVLVPRHPERFGSVGELCQARGFNVVRRSSGALPDQADVLLGDTMGELLLMFGASDIAFVGGSLVPNGGHNFMEPAAWALPLLSGTHVFNFAESSRLLQEAGALTLVENASDLSQALLPLIASVELRRSKGAAALQVVDANRGALARTLAVIEPFLAPRP